MPGEISAAAVSGGMISVSSNDENRQQHTPPVRSLRLVDNIVMLGNASCKGVTSVTAQGGGGRQTSMFNVEEPARLRTTGRPVAVQWRAVVDSRVRLNVTRDGSSVNHTLAYPI